MPRDQSVVRLPAQDAKPRRVWWWQACALCVQGLKPPSGQGRAVQAGRVAWALGLLAEEVRGPGAAPPGRAPVQRQ